MLVPVLISALLVALAVVIHAEVLRRLVAWLPNLKLHHELKLVVGVLGAIVAHIAEILLFAVAYYLMHSHPALGYLDGNFDGSFRSSVYFSFTTYTSLGLGDIEPHGGLRFLVGLEALAGLVLITWTASFMFIEMQKYWDRGSRSG